MPDDNAKFKKLPKDLKELRGFQLAEINVVFSKEFMGQMKDAFIREYGDNYRIKSIKYRNEAGDTIVIKNLIWENSSGAIGLSDYFGKGRSSVVMSHIGLMRKLMKRISELSMLPIPGK